MESGQVSGTDTDKNHEPHNSIENKSSGAEAEAGRSTDGTANEHGSTPLASSDRIPSRVFSRTSTTTPTEWSAASNESLFSIHAGNTSFSKEQLSVMCKPGDLGGYDCNSINISSPLLELPGTRQFTDFAMKSGVTESAAAESMREVLMEQECQQNRSRSVSTPSHASVQSFAFPILAEGDKCVSLKNSTMNKKEESQAPPKVEKNRDISQDLQETLKTQAQKSTKNAASKKWFNCCSCCCF